MIQFCHVTKEYDGRYQALADVSFFIDKAEFIFLTGKSGAGKTTLLKHIYMEEAPSSGQVFVCGYDSRYIKRRDIPYLRRKLGIVFQDFRFLSDRDVFENIAFAMRVTGARQRQIKRKVFEVLALVGLSHKSSFFPQQLSGGEQQRVCIARAIVNDPWVLLADEPTGNLDAAVSAEVLALLQQINCWGTTVIMATHDLHLIEHYHYRHLNLDRGMVLADGDAWRKPKLYN
ncbi:MAG: cell division ATP-binding protein FtsE [Chitinivibrionales bacterium]|nr:cell division ATP-binding protein FtsE [Chitinivibrionales bacterium]